ncbi:Polysulfide reductase, NrfD [Halanaeroarchaeum sp. HSR-CO]|uniref:NrfD/PsrC family molybdoenzyme membrane anchor subunit n=1 Tax=Halanaeroarchaeum sp. HSR-CO TaxID=2866382 RepID=UPI00217D36E9|nr:NrfD/PsrC family molybdoenzyme membrane anchor subunit [Halanaeroarchaeum sp. HSR-CO]UWG46613.1 Polysulfide reductase, NrfD [Halanaeroarchaeum sp. HSR-CO]
MSGAVVEPEGFGTRGKALVGVLVLLIGVGFAAWLYQLREGLVVTGMDNVFSWALYIMLFVFFVGLSAGGLIISSVPKFFHSDRYDSIAALGVLVSFACIVVAGLLIVPDIGRPVRMYQFLTTPDFRSPMVWDFAVVVVYGLFTLGYLWLLTRRNLAARGSPLALGVADTESGRARDKKLAFWAAAVAIPLAVALHSVTGWIFALQIGRGDWFSPLVAPMFIMKALVSGLALVIVTAVLADRYTRFELSRDLVPELGKILGVFVAVHIVYLLAAERLPHAWAANFDFWSITSAFLIGDTPYFWLWTIVGGAIPIALLVFPSLRRQVWAVVTASVFAIVGILFEGVNLVFVGYDEVPIADAPGVTTGREYTGFGADIWATSGTYTPTVVELAISVGIIAVGALIVTLGIRYLPVFPRVERETVERQSPATDAAVTDGGAVADAESGDEGR